MVWYRLQAIFQPIIHSTIKMNRESKNWKKKSDSYWTMFPFEVCSWFHITVSMYLMIINTKRNHLHALCHTCHKLTRTMLLYCLPLLHSGYNKVTGMEQFDIACNNHVFEGWNTEKEGATITTIFVCWFCIVAWQTVPYLRTNVKVDTCLYYGQCNI